MALEGGRACFMSWGFYTRKITRSTDNKGIFCIPLSYIVGLPDHLMKLTSVSIGHLQHYQHSTTSETKYNIPTAA